MAILEKLKALNILTHRLLIGKRSDQSVSPGHTNHNDFSIQLPILCYCRLVIFDA